MRDALQQTIDKAASLVDDKQGKMQAHDMATPVIESRESQLECSWKITKHAMLEHKGSIDRCGTQVPKEESFIGSACVIGHLTANGISR